MAPLPDPLRILSWNLFHGRSVPPTRHALLGAFATQIASWPWDIALLQEVPPWWCGPLAAATGSEGRLVLTSRNGLLAARRAIASRAPELARSNGGGANAVLVRGTQILEQRRWRLRRWPERRVAQAVRLVDGTWVVNFHASTRRDRGAEEVRELWARASALPGERLILGGDLNLFDPPRPEHGVVHAAAQAVDHIFVRGFTAAESAQQPASRILLNTRQIRLSDHDPVLATVRRVRRVT